MSGHEDSQLPQLRRQVVAEMPAVRSYCLRLTRNAADADDLLQDTLMRALANLRRFVPGTNLKAWLFTIARNTFCSWRRKLRRERECGLEAAAEVATPSRQDGHLELALVGDALRKLPLSQREAVVMTACTGLSYEEAAEACGCAIGTIRSRVNRGRTRLAELTQ